MTLFLSHHNEDYEIFRKSINCISFFFFLGHWPRGREFEQKGNLLIPPGVGDGQGGVSRGGGCSFALIGVSVSLTP